MKAPKNAPVMDFQEELEKLKRLPPERLMLLPDGGEEKLFKKGWRTFSHIVWHDQAVDGRHRIVLAEYDKTIGKVRVDGFSLDESGIGPLSDKDLLDFS